MYILYNICKKLKILLADTLLNSFNYICYISVKFYVFSFKYELFVA